jgi:pimeloyl-ACP methyl ester carboxylesterase
MTSTSIDSLYYQARNYLYPNRLNPKTDDSMHQVSLANAVVRYREVGQGSQTIILCPDLPNTIEHDANLIKLLQPSARVICIEMPGQGFSFPGRKFSFGLLDYSAVLTELLERLQVRNAILSAPCLYSFAALHVAFTRPDLVKKLVFTQTPSLSEEQAWCRLVDFNKKNIINRPVLGQALMLTGKSFISKKWYRFTRGQNRFYEKYLETTLKAFEEGACFCLASLFQTFHDWRLPENFRIKQEVISIWGLADRSHLNTDKQSLLSHVPEARIVHFDDCGHFPELDRSEEFGRLLLG